jgi:uncharacterized protein YutE (UPF0331/DUF86 family)
VKREAKFRLLKHINFLETELKDYDTFKSLSWTEYNDDRHKRRDVERWVENIINSSIDISKIILNAEGKSLPDTYKEVVKSFCAILKFEEEDMNNLSELIKLRNIVSHEYLDIRWTSVKRFITETKPLYVNFLDEVKRYLDKKNAESGEKS